MPCDFGWEEGKWVLGGRKRDKGQGEDVEGMYILSLLFPFCAVS